MTNDQRVDAAAVDRGLGSEIEEEARVGRCREEVGDLELEKIWGLENELL